MKEENKSEKKLSLKKVQITRLNMIRGGDGDTMTNGDTTSSKCPPKTATTTKLPPIVILGGDDGGNGGGGAGYY